MGGPGFRRRVHGRVKDDVSASRLSGRCSKLGSELDRAAKTGGELTSRVSRLSMSSGGCSGGCGSVRRHLSGLCSRVASVRSTVRRIRAELCGVERSGVSRSGICRFLLFFSGLCSGFASLRGGAFLGDFLSSIFVCRRRRGSNEVLGNLQFGFPVCVGNEGMLNIS